MNVREFRKDLSKHMDSAEKGAEVRVTRGNKVFELKAIGVHGSMVIAQNHDPDLDRYIQANKALNAAPVPTIHRVVMDESGQLHGTDAQFCKHNAVKGFCKKGCK